jgi:hypothetical protein
LAYGAPVFLWSGDSPTADRHVARLIEHAGRYSLQPFRLTGLGLKGAIAVARDEVATGIHLLRSALQILMAKDLNLYPLTFFMGVLADGLRESGQMEEASLQLIGLSGVQQIGE